MGLFSKLSAWIADLFGGGKGDERADESAKEDTKRGEGDSTEDGEKPSAGLDPSATTEVRTDATDDAVDALRDVRQAQNASAESDDDTAATAEGDADANTGGDADRDPADRDRP